MESETSGHDQLLWAAMKLKRRKEKGVNDE